jgi:hypothetical protein
VYLPDQLLGAVSLVHVGLLVYVCCHPVHVSTVCDVALLQCFLMHSWQAAWYCFLMHSVMMVSSGSLFSDAVSYGFGMLFGTCQCWCIQRSALLSRVSVWVLGVSASQYSVPVVSACWKIAGVAMLYMFACYVCCLLCVLSAMCVVCYVCCHIAAWYCFLMHS